MDVELAEIRDFIRRFHPFDLLPKEIVNALPPRMQTTYAKRGQTVCLPGEENEFLHIVRTGAVEQTAPDGTLLARLSEGETFGFQALLGDGKTVNRVVAIEDTLLYLMPHADFEQLRRDFPQFAYFFTPLAADRLRGARSFDASSDDQLKLMAVKIRDIMTPAPICISKSETIRTAGQWMSNHNISCLLITEGDQLQGIVTDRDLRNRVVAKGLAPDTLVEQVMTPNPTTLDIECFALDALLTMAQRNISHLPITRDGNIAGIVTNTNLVRRQTMSAVHMVADIHKRKTHEGLAETVKKIPQLLISLVDAGATAHHIGHIITSIGDAATTRLLTLAEKELGPPPVPYVWMASGSQARQEQTGISDQDNCMIIHDDYDPKAHHAYFESLAHRVCDGLNACGYYYCPGDMMATTAQWRQPIDVWRGYFSKWIDEPEPKALMLSSIFFDFRPVGGDDSLYEDLRQMISEKAKSNSIFVAHMVGNALTHSPPLGFFKNLVLVSNGEHNNTLDLKHSGVVPVVDLARIYALQSGIDAVNTFDRLSIGKENKVLSESGARDLLDAYEFIAITRLRHQAQQINNGKNPDNFLDPEELSHFERNHLKDAFSVIKVIQSAMASAHNIGI